MLTIEQLFMRLYNKIDTEFAPEEFVEFFNYSLESDSAFDHLKMGQFAKVETFAQRRMIAVGTPVGPLVVGEVWPRDSSRLRVIEAPRLIRTVMKDPDHFLTSTDWVKLFGNEETNSPTYWTTGFIERFNQPQQEFLFESA